MCIRDRISASTTHLYVFVSYIFNLIFGKENFVYPLLIFNSLSVSYTHLDVYKRQDYDFAYSSLKSLPKDDLFFVYGDNDTYPIWAIQETEEFRSDVKVVNFTLLGTPWNIDQVKRRTYDAMPVPSILNHDDYRDGTNDQVVVLTAEDWKNFIQNNVNNGVPEEVFAPYKKYMVQDSMSIKDAVNFLKIKSESKNEILKLLFGEEKYERFNFLPVSKFVLPVNKANAVKSGIISAKDLPNTVDNITTVSYTHLDVYKRQIWRLAYFLRTKLYLSLIHI